jgi:hypothetical protein
VLGRVGVPGANVFVLQRFELLLGAEFVGLDRCQVLVLEWIKIGRVGVYYHFYFVSW